MSETTTYKTITLTPPGKGHWSPGSPVARLVDAGWTDGTKGGGYAKPAPGYKPPRTPDGQPDLQGVWAVTTTLLGRSALGTLDRPPNTPVVDPPNGNIPYKPGVGDRGADFWDHYVHPVSSCVPTGVPLLMYYIDYQIIQTSQEVLIMSEHLSNFRHIRLDSSPHPGGDLKLWMGDSRGHWEGNTLVVDVANMNDETWLSFRGDVHSDGLHITERLTPIAPDTIQYEATLDDPVVFAKPWKMAFPIIRTPNYEMLEENCGEGNKDLLIQLEAGRKIFTGLKNEK